MTAEVAALVTFLAVVLIIAGPYYLFILRTETADKEMIRQRIRTGAVTVRTRTAAGVLKDVERMSVVGPLNRFLAGNNAMAVRLRDAIQLSGIKATPGQVVMASACTALLAYTVVFFKTGYPAAGVIAACGGLFIPYGAVSFMRSRRLNKFEEQFPEAVDLVARTLRAGHAFTTGLGMAAEELPQPVAAEFQLLYDQQNYGLPLGDALKELARRVPLIDTRFFVTAVLTQREAGGNLAEVLDNLSGVIRERFKIKRQLRVLTAHGRITGWILAGMPPVVALYMFIQRPEYTRLLIEDPLGREMLWVAAALQVVGAFLIYKISDVDY
ncbi:MAG: type II secretion system F family protein [Vicinamibacterales bacterium]